MQLHEGNDMTTHDQWKQNTTDPLGLGNLEALDPGYDGWAGVESALLSYNHAKRNWQRAGGWLAIAASFILVVSITLRNTENPDTEYQGLSESMPADVATPGTNFASVSVQDNIGALIGLSQDMEEQVKKLRQETSSMPAESAIYVAGLEDLIARVDSELSFTPDSIDLWGQRVNLLLDLAQIYQQQWQIGYGRLASL